jgi:flagellar motor component MotA
MTRFIVFTVLMLAFIVGAVVLEGGSLAPYLGLTTFTIVLLVPFFSAFAVWGFRDIGRAFRNALGKGPEAGPLDTSLQVWEFFEKTIYTAAVLGLVLGLVLILSSRSELPRDLAAIGRPLGLGLLSLVYGFFLGIVARILRTRVEERRDGGEEGSL